MDELVLDEWYREFDIWLKDELTALDGKRRTALSIWWAQALIGRSYDYLTQHLKDNDFALLVTILDKCWKWVIGAETITKEECLALRDAIYGIVWEEDTCDVVTADDAVQFSRATNAIGSVECVVESVRTGDAKFDSGVVFSMMGNIELEATSLKETGDLIAHEADRVATAVEFLKGATVLSEANRDQFSGAKWRGIQS